jgi:hypothetical protein
MITQTTFQVDRCGKGQSFWFRFPTDKGGVLLDRAELRRLKSQGVNWLSLIWQDAWWEWDYKVPRLADPSALISVIEQCNDYGFRTVLRLGYERDERQKLYAGTQLRGFDEIICSTARIYNHLPRTLNAFQPVHEWGLIGDAFTDEERKKATLFVEKEYARWCTKIWEICPDLSVVLSPPGWGKPWTRDHEYMGFYPPNTLIGHDIYGGPPSQVAEVNEFWKLRRKRWLAMEYLDPAIGKACAAVGVGASLWRDR